MSGKSSGVRYGLSARWIGVSGVRVADAQEETRTPAAFPADEHDSLSYFYAVARGKRKSTGLSSLENNVIVTEILEAAKDSARTGSKVQLARKP